MIEILATGLRSARE